MEFINELKCLKCKGKNLAYNKIYWKSKYGQRYRYLIVCVDCQTRYFMKRREFEELNPCLSVTT